MRVLIFEDKERTKIWGLGSVFSLSEMKSNGEVTGFVQMDGEDFLDKKSFLLQDILVDANAATVMKTWAPDERPGVDGIAREDANGYWEEIQIGRKEEKRMTWRYGYFDRQGKPVVTGTFHQE